MRHRERATSSATRCAGARRTRTGSGGSARSRSAPASSDRLIAPWRRRSPTRGEVATIVKARGAVARVDAAGRDDRRRPLQGVAGRTGRESLVALRRGLRAHLGSRHRHAADRRGATRSALAGSVDRRALSRRPLREGLGASRRRNILKLLRAVLRWGRNRHPNALTVEFSGLFEVPAAATQPPPLCGRRGRGRADHRGGPRAPARDDLLPDPRRRLRRGDGLHGRRPALGVAAVGDLGRPARRTVELQRGPRMTPRTVAGLKTGAHVALLLPNASDRLFAYRDALEDRFGPQPDNGLVFQVLEEDGPVWVRRPRRRARRRSPGSRRLQPLDGARLATGPRGRGAGARCTGGARRDDLLRSAPHRASRWPFTRPS